MFDEKVLEYLEAKKVYHVVEEGWFYSKILGVFDTKSEAISMWEKVTHHDYSDYDYLRTNYNKKSNGPWYYAVKEASIFDAIQKEMDNIKEATISESAKEIVKKGNDEIYYQGWNDSRKETNKIFKGLLHYLRVTTTILDGRFDSDEWAKSFKELNEKYK